MAEVTIVNEKTIKIAVQLEDALTMIRDAQTHITEYAFDIVTMVEKCRSSTIRIFAFMLTTAHRFSSEC